MQKFQIQVQTGDDLVVFHATAHDERAAERIARKRFPGGVILGMCGAYSPQVPSVTASMI